MAKAKLTTRAISTTSVTSDNLAKGSQLTHNQLDSNFLNLRDASFGVVGDDSATIQVGMDSNLYVQGTGGIQTTTDSTGAIIIDGSNLSSLGDLTAIGSTLVSPSNAAITLDPSGTGTIELNANTNVTGDLTTSAISLIDNKISTTRSNDHITIDPAGTGTIELNADTNVTGDLTTSAISIVDNTISTTSTNADLELSANATGSVTLNPESYGATEKQVIIKGGGSNVSGDLWSQLKIVDSQGTNLLLGDSWSHLTRGSTIASGSGMLNLQGAAGGSDINLYASGVAILGGPLKIGFGSGSPGQYPTCTIKTPGNSQDDKGNDLEIRPGEDYATAGDIVALGLRIGGGHTGTTITADATNASVTLEGNGTGNVVLGNFPLDGDATVGSGQDNYVLTYDHSAGTIGLEATAFLTTGDLTFVGSTITAPSNADLTLALSGTGDIILDQITVHDNTISTNATNADLEISANGSGSLRFGTQTLDNTGLSHKIKFLDAAWFNNDVNAINLNGNIAFNSSASWRNITGCSGLYAEYIQPRVNDFDIKVSTGRASGFDITDNVTNFMRINTITDSIAFDGTSISFPGLEFEDASITGTRSNENIIVTPAGTGTIELKTNTNVTGAFTATTSIANDAIKIDDHTISGLRSNDNIIIDPAGTGVIQVTSNIDLNGLKITGGSTSAPSADGDLTNKKYVDDNVSSIAMSTITSGTTNVTVASTSITGTVSGATLFTGNAASGFVVSNNAISTDGVTINDNKITASRSNDNLILDATGTGDILLGNFRFDIDQSVGSGQDNYVLTFDNGTGKISLEASAGGGGSADTGDITFVGSTIISPSNADITLNPAGTGKVNINAVYTLPNADGSANEVLGTNGSGVLSFRDPTAINIDGGVADSTYTSVPTIDGGTA